MKTGIENSIKQKIILLSIIMLPLFTIEEQMFYYGISDSRQIMLQNIKIIKDLMFVAIYLVSFFSYLQKGLPKTSAYFFLFYALLFLCFVAAPNIQSGFAGMRWCHIFFLCFCLDGCVDDIFMMKIGKVLRILLILQIISQVYELFHMPPIQGINSMGLANRVPGMFVHPSTAGAFASVNYLFMVLYKKQISKKVFRCTFLMVVASQIMAMSSTGVAVLFSLYFFYKFKSRKNTQIIFVTFILLCPLIFSNLDFLTGRNDGSTQSSGGTRIEIMKDTFDEIEVISTQFGLFTNTAVSMELPNSKVVDSSFTSIIANVGLLGFLYIFIPLIWIFLYSINIGNNRLLLTMVWILGVSIPIITLELFPCNIIIAILLNYWLSILRSKKHDESITYWYT